MDIERPEWVGQMEVVLETLNEGVMITDDCHHIVSVNECLKQMTGLAEGDLIGKTPACFYTGEDQKFLNQQIIRGEQQGQNRFEFYVPQRDGSRLPVMISARLIEDPDGRQFAVVTFTDISEQKQAEERLRQANHELEERHKEIEAELALAARVQQSLAPKSLRWGRIAVEAFYQPVRSIGGDFGLVSPRGDGQLNLLVCDVSGHGISSALVANRIYTEITALLESGTEMGAMLRQLNRLMLDHIQLGGYYFTLAAARLDAACRLTFAGAGHPPAIVVAADGSIRQLESRSMPLGFLEGAVQAEPTTVQQLHPGDRVVLYSDGLTEVFDGNSDLLGVEGLERIIAKAARHPLEQMKQAILDGVEAWRSGPLTDDMSLVLVETH